MTTSKAQKISDFKVEGSVLAPFTPFKENGDIDVDKIPEYIEKNIQKYGVPNVFVLGTTGEGASLTTSERKVVAEAWVKAARGRLNSVIVHVGGGNLRESIELAKHAEEIGADAIAAYGSVYYKPKSEEAVVQYLKHIGASAPNLPLYYYDINFMTGIYLDASKILELGRKDIPTLRGIKHSSKSMSAALKCTMVQGMQVIQGAVDQYFGGLTMGVDNPVLGLSLSNQFTSSIKEAYLRGDMNEALRHQEKLQRLYSLTERAGGSIGTKRAILKIVDGMDLGQCRCPIIPPTEEQIKQLNTDLKDAGII